MDRESAFEFGEFIVDRTDERVWGPHGTVHIGNKAFRVLVMLIEQRGRLLTKEVLFETVWDGTIVSESALTSVIKELRHALGEARGAPRFIETVYGRGYRFLAPVRILSELPSRCSVPVATAEPGHQRSPEPGGAGEPPLLYVPPFDDAGIADSHPHLASILREEILFSLSRFRDVRLVSAQNADGGGAMAGTGDRDYQLVLTLVDEPGAVKVYARLCRLANQAVVWADAARIALDGSSFNVEDLLHRIAAAALPSMRDDVLRNLPRHATDAYDVYFQNRLLMRRIEGFSDARAMADAWEAMIARYPDFGLAYPPLIRLYNTDFDYTGLGATGRAERARAHELAARALALDPGDSHIHTVNGWCHLWAGELVPARAHLDEALRLNPYNANRLVQVATALMFLADIDAAVALLERCKKLTPFATEAPHEEEGLLHLLMRDYAAAARSLAQVTRRTISSEFYALIAAQALGVDDAGDRAAQWRRHVSARWVAAEPLDNARLMDWLMFQHPIQDIGQRDTILALLRAALEAHPSPSPRNHAPKPLQSPA
ncbi:winged helix-turn-helix domain-containing protein [Sphingomonas sp. LaA6.9]|uniref:winged helix-turn-helix domain-containing protein n=1 Tax=Sphingomonas sp. LaA6.9 TaxID=2919914 RepID=UPI001F4F7D3F|nr:winged helix-turn-helix domain-containing protein [Sphingomonas sp. LaA6.9]MCJ8158455.1 winged helix-turn-helix domain-containing protein [Sphingomonas sp. LaA6.9]